MPLHRLWVVPVLTCALVACSANDDRAAQQRERTRAIAAVAFPVPLEELAKRPGVRVEDLQAGKGSRPVPPRTFVRVGREAATGGLSLGAVVARLDAEGWTLQFGTDSASTCDDAQSLPCLFSRDGAEDSLSVVVLPGGGYELTASEVEGPPFAS